jgi:hypothetical protein
VYRGQQQPKLPCCCLSSQLLASGLFHTVSSAPRSVPFAFPWADVNLSSSICVVEVCCCAVVVCAWSLCPAGRHVNSTRYLPVELATAFVVLAPSCQLVNRSPGHYICSCAQDIPQGLGSSRSAYLPLVWFVVVVCGRLLQQI